MPNPDSGRWGILGGSFDPVHNGHLNLAQSISDKKHLDGVIFIPAFHHPFKQDRVRASYNDRVEMLKLAQKNTFQLCEIEKDESLSGYTIDTVRALKMRFPQTQFHFIIGLDLVKQIENWHKADELLKEVHFLAGSRPGEDEDSIDSDMTDSVEIVRINELNISASDIRNKIKSGAAIDEIKKLVPTPVAEYIFEKGLYR